MAYQIVICDIPVEPLLSRFHAIKDRMEPQHTSYALRKGFAHNDPVQRQLHCGPIHILVTGILKESLKPTYCYLSRYERGSGLGRHVDRPPCYVTVSHMLYADPPHADTEWPIDIAGAKVGLTAGQAVIFKGTELPHSRTQMPGHIREFVNAYYHYVPIDYTGGLD
jgi:hypothetical protein